MPSFVNIAAWVGPGTMVDTWATVGSGAQIGANVHLAGGVGIGGVLEPPGARPVIVEDGAFLGSRCIVVEGVRIGREAVLAPNVTLTASVPIIDVTGPEPVEHRGYVPPRAVVVPDRLPRRRVMIGSEGASMLVQVALGVLLVTGNATMSELFALQALGGAAFAFFTPASAGLVPQTVAAGQLQQANGLMSVARYSAYVFGAAV